MASVTSFVGQLRGVLAYSDNSVGGFHIQMETKGNQLYWTINEPFSIDGFVEADRDARPGRDGIYNAAVGNLMEAAPFITEFGWGIVPWAGEAKEINDAVYVLTMTLSLDDNSSNVVSATYERNTVTLHSDTEDAISSVDNFAAVFASIQAMFEQITGLTVTTLS